MGNIKAHPSIFCLLLVFGQRATRLCFNRAFLLLQEGKASRGGDGGEGEAGVTSSRSVLSARAV